jgi:hypothetical protein
MKTPTEVVILVTAMVIALVVELLIFLGLLVSMVSLAVQGPTVWNVGGSVVFGAFVLFLIAGMVRR